MTPAYAVLEVAGRRFGGVLDLLRAVERGEMGRCGLIFGCFESGPLAGGRFQAGRFVTLRGGTVLFQDLEPAEGPGEETAS